MASSSSASSAKGLLDAALRFLRDPWKVLPGPSSGTEWKPAIYKAMEYRTKAPQNAGKAVTPHAERDRIYDIRYFNRDHRRDTTVETTTEVTSGIVKGAVEKGATEAELAKLFPGKYYKAGTKKHILDHQGAGYQA